MKKIALTLGLLLSVLALSQCSKENVGETIEQSYDRQEPILLQADFQPLAGARTRLATTPEGKVSWEASDKLTAFVVPSGTEEWKGNKYEFTTTAELLATNSFMCQGATQPDLSGATDWYVMYPGNDHVVDPKGTIESAMAINLASPQTQSYASPTKELSKNTIMVGVAKEVAPGSDPKVTLKHPLNLLKFTINNKLTKGVYLKSIQFESSEDLIADYSVDFETGKLTPLTTPKKKVYLNVTSSKSLAKGKSYDVYVLTAPFVLPVNGTFTVTVFTDKGVFKTTMTAPQAVSFKAGSMNTAQIDVQSLTVPNVVDNQNIDLMNGTKTSATNITIVSASNEFPGLKLGTDKGGGSYITPALAQEGAFDLNLFAYAWNGRQSQLKISVLNAGAIDGANEKIINLTGNDGFSGNVKTFYTSILESEKLTFKLTGLTSASQLKFETVVDAQNDNLDPRVILVHPNLTSSK